MGSIVVERPNLSEETVRQVHEWRCDPTTMKNSFYQTVFSWDSFRRLFRTKFFPCPGLPPFFLRDGDERVAVVTFRPCEYGSPRSVVLSVVVPPNKRGKGYGLQAVQAATRIAQEQNIETLVAYVRPENEASIKLFTKAGYTYVSTDEHSVEEIDGKISAQLSTYILQVKKPARSKVFIIAEIGSNWFVGSREENREMAKRLIDAAAQAGVDAVKFQTYRAKDLYAPMSGKSDYLAEAGIDVDIHELLGKLEMPDEEIPFLAQLAKEAGVEFMSTPFSIRDFDAVDPYVSYHKIASYEVAYTPLLERVAKSKKPVFLSTGASNLDEIAWSVEQLQKYGCTDLTLLQCTAAYPAKPVSANISALETLRQTFGLPVGLSDHSLDPVTAPILAAGFGATVIEKHLTLSRDLPGPDNSFALEACELPLFVEKIRLAEEMVGSGHKHVLPQEEELFAFAKRAVQATQDIGEGEEIVEGKNVALLRPGNNSKGAHPSKLPEISGKKASRAIRAGEGVLVEDAM